MPVPQNQPQVYDKRLQVVKTALYKNQHELAPNGDIGLRNFTPSLQNLQHIAEREPDDVEMDPTLNPTKETLLMQRSCRDVEYSMKKRRSFYDKNELGTSPSHDWIFVFAKKKLIY
ncbi:hypothetical protein Ciccas_007287 [Cichlidogyrus casuarinus]|uniref:NT-3 n=1 Tax=Cichlidogyrus casuarinus TaxID=1844966 RepID=A0ABD2Q3B0_9PLAT